MPTILAGRPSVCSSRIKPALSEPSFGPTKRADVDERREFLLLKVLGENLADRP